MTHHWKAKNLLFPNSSYICCNINLIDLLKNYALLHSKSTAIRESEHSTVNIGDYIRHGHE